MHAGCTACSNSPRALANTVQTNTIKPNSKVCMQCTSAKMKAVMSSDLHGSNGTEDKLWQLRAGQGDALLARQNHQSRLLLSLILLVHLEAPLAAHCHLVRLRLRGQRHLHICNHHDHKSYRNSLHGTQGLHAPECASHKRMHWQAGGCMCISKKLVMHARIALTGPCVLSPQPSDI